MVAQSCETVYDSVTPPWGRTSPIAASTADDHQPMDLVTRKRGQSDDHQLEGNYGCSSNRGSISVPEVAAGVHEEPNKLLGKQDLSHGVGQPQQESLQTEVVSVVHNQQHQHQQQQLHQLRGDGEGQEPTAPDDGDPRKTELLQFSDNALDQIRKTAEMEKQFLCVYQDGLQSNQTVYQMSGIQQSLQVSLVQQSLQTSQVEQSLQGDQSPQTKQFGEIDNQLQVRSVILQRSNGQGALPNQSKQQQQQQQQHQHQPPMKLKQMKQELLSRWEFQNAQQQKLEVQSENQEKIQQSEQVDTAHNNNKQGQRILVSQDHQIVLQEQPIKFEDQQIILQNQQTVLQDQLEEGTCQRNVRIVYRDELQQQSGVNQDSPQDQQPKGNQNLHQDKRRQDDKIQIRMKVEQQGDSFEQESTSEGASSLLLLADREFDKNAEDNASPLKQLPLNQYQQNSLDLHPTKGKNLTKNANEEGIESSNNIWKPVRKQEPEDGYCDDEKDGTLLIIDGNIQITGLEDLQDDNTTTFKPSVCKREVHDDIDVVEFVSTEEEFLEKDEKQGGVSKSCGRLESQKKMEEGKLWLVNSLMVIGSLSSVIRLSDIETSYWSYCKMNGKEPLATPVLARLIHSLFPMAKKCRLGARGNQRIHYRSLVFKSDTDKTQQQSAQQQKDIQNEVSKQQQKDNQNEVSKQDSQQTSGNCTLPTQSNMQVSQQTAGNCTLPAKSNMQVSQQTAGNCTLPAKSNIQTIQMSSEKEENANQQEFETDTKIQYSAFVDCDILSSESQSSLPESKENNGIISQDDEEGCKPAAKKLSDVLKWITGQGEGHKKALLRDFAHSASCQKPSCMPVCLMFRRVRRHVVNAQHSCSVLRLYSMLLRHHVSSCTQPKCGLPACPALRATRSNKRPLEQQLQPAKRAAVAQFPGIYRPSSMVLAPRSPGGSLPGSPVNSPPASPSSTPGRSVLSLPSGLQSGQVQYVVVPIMMPIVENRVA